MNDHAHYRDPDAVYFLKFGDLLCDFPDLLASLKKRKGDSSWSKCNLAHDGVVEGWVMDFGYRPGGLLTSLASANDP